MSGDVGTGSGNITGAYKFDKSDNKLWNQTYAPEGFYSLTFSIRQTADKGYIIPVNIYTNYGTGSPAIWLLKTNKQIRHL